MLICLLGLVPFLGLGVAQPTASGTQILRLDLTSGSLTHRFDPVVKTATVTQLRFDSTGKLNVATNAISADDPASIIKFSNTGTKRVGEITPANFDSPTTLAFDILGNSYVGATYSGALFIPRIFLSFVMFN